MKKRECGTSRARSWWLVLPVLWILFILGTSFMPPGRAMTGGWGFDRADLAAHFFAYAGLAGMMYPVAVGRPFLVRMAAVLVFPLCLGGAVELLQPLVGRTRSWEDAAANASGALLGWAVGAALGRNM